MIKYWYKKIKVTIKHWSLGTIVHILTRRFQRHKDVVSIFISDDLKKSVSKTSLNFLVSIILPRHQRRGVTFFFVLEFFFLCCCYCCWFNTLFSIRELKIYWRCWLVFVAIFIAFLPVSRWRWRSYYLWVLWHLYILYGNFMKIRFRNSKLCIEFAVHYSYISI